MKKKSKYMEPDIPNDLKEYLGIENTPRKKINKSNLGKRPIKGASQSKSNKTRPTMARPLSDRSPVKQGDKRRNLEDQRNISKPKGSTTKRTEKNIGNRPPERRREEINRRSNINAQRTTKNPNKGKIDSRKKVVHTSSAKKKQVKKSKFTFKKLIYLIFYSISGLIAFLTEKDNGEVKIKSNKKLLLDKKFYGFLSISFIIVLLFSSAVVMFHGSSKVSVAEKRVLQQKPSFSLSSYFKGNYIDEATNYVSDQFPDRTGFIKLYARYQKFIGKDQINGVYICKDGYLMNGFKEPDKASTQAKVDAVNKFSVDSPKLAVTMMLVPNKVEIYNNLLPKYAQVDSEVDYSKEVKSLLRPNIKYVNMFDSFNKSKNNEQLYFKTDHHWTPDGAFLGYQDYCSAVNMQPVSANAFTRTLASNNFLGSLYYKNGAQIGEKEKFYIYVQQGDFPVIAKYFDTKKKVPSLYDVSKLNSSDQYEVFQGGNHSQVNIRTKVDTKRKLLLIKDSYACSMLPFLVNNYSEIEMIDLRYFTGSLKDVINNNDFTDVLILMNIDTFSTDSSILSIND